MYESAWMVLEFLAKIGLLAIYVYKLLNHTSLQKISIAVAYRHYILYCFSKLSVVNKYFSKLRSSRLNLIT
jgi:hypothetical protein